MMDLGYQLRKMRQVCLPFRCREFGIPNGDVRMTKNGSTYYEGNKPRLNIEFPHPLITKLFKDQLFSMATWPFLLKEK
jgi:hypothetical protein